MKTIFEWAAIASIVLFPCAALLLAARLILVR